MLNEYKESSRQSKFDLQFEASAEKIRIFWLFKSKNFIFCMKLAKYFIIQLVLLAVFPQHAAILEIFFVPKVN